MDVKESFAQRFEQALIKRGLFKKSQKEIGKLLGVSSTMISHYLNGKKMPSMDTVVDICIKLKISVEWLLSGRGEMEIQSSINQFTKSDNIYTLKQSDVDLSDTSISIKMFPIIKWEHVYLWSTRRMDKDIFKNAEMHESSYTGINCFFLTVESESLQPDIKIGEKVLIDCNADCDDKDFVVVLDGKRAFLRQLILDGGKRYLKSTNPDWPNKIEVMTENQQIIGVAIEVTRKLK